MGTNTTEALPLIMLLEVQGEILGGVDTIVGVIFLDSVAKMRCLPLKNNFRAYCFLGSKTDLVVDAQKRAGSISENGAAFERLCCLRVAATGEISPGNRGNKLIRKNSLAWRQLPPT